MAESADNVPEYGADSIKVLRGLDAVRKRPGMYIGDTDDGSGLHHMVYEVVDNGIDEALGGYADYVHVKIHADNSVSVRDNGRGIPTDIHAEEGVSAAEVIMTQLHAGGKFDQNSYKVSGGLHGVGVSVVNALSDWLELTIWGRDGNIHFARFETGDTVEHLRQIGKTNGETGTEVRFLASLNTFSNLDYSFEMLEKRLRELAFLNSGVKIILEDERPAVPLKSELSYEGGVREFVRYLDRSKTPLMPEPIHVTGERDGITVEVAMWWNDSYHETVLPFTNNIPQRDGGTHMAGFRGALTRAIQKYVAESGIAKKEKVSLTGDDAREGLTCVLSVKVPDPKFSSQTKDKLVSSEVRPAVENLVNEKLGEWFEENPAEAKGIITKIVEAAAAREAARKAREIRRKSAMDVSYNASKLKDCSEKDPSKTEVFLVEGDSAGGSAQTGRDRRTQAILPLRGKILNVERARFDRMLSSQEIGNLVMALGTGIGRDEFNINKLRYHKIVIMTDADVDGAHIRTLLLTFFFRQMPELIEGGYLYIAQPPLYKVARGRSEVYLKDQPALDDYLIQQGVDGAILKLGSGMEITGRDLARVVEEARQLRRVLDAFPTHYQRHILEQAAIAGAFVPGAVDADLQGVADKVAARLDLIALEYEKGWSGRITQDKGIRLSRILRGVEELRTLDGLMLRSGEARRTGSFTESLKEVYERPATLVRKDRNQTIYGPLDLLEAILEEGQRGLTLQRYKGLGEMNPSQLWETTLDPDARTLLQVRIDDATEADDLFTKLMGDVVEPRREFIQQNALNVEHLDF
ncbi:DNA topoisomerase (ATP-hydrolyzing) subunit B [Pseudoroseicyclus sp. CXY001]|uniref:DNA topoisomerase (ATP-hydrolyzing) subunit B n=1 Tax=Pseudoroseicyclus sp. CXY001 TaxID=3242492 RepID=UPI00357143E0